ncbi:cysteine-S-conjugate beta-lyase [Malassezia cuniculi]|uniref:Cystathionine beta-lyase n=1 Tax=Malassezia cuniculi TaxID=948313 RepID=A0AAF0EUU8_9BASI|nr:cysteine-S-conjugate beta-lyase [Malassezia cuniculi]
MTSNAPRTDGTDGTDAPAYRLATRCVVPPKPEYKDQYGSSQIPVYLTSTFKGNAEFDYTRCGNPTRSALQSHLSQLQECRHTFAVSSGMAAMDIIARFARPGDRVIAGDDLYGGTHRLLVLLKNNCDITTDNIHMADAAVFESHVKKCAAEQAAGGPRVSLVLLESPTNPLLKVCDVQKYARLVHENLPDALVVMDNTMMSPYLMRPLDLGVDITYDSATKYLSGHHDLMAGVIACNRDDLAERIYFFIISVGNALSPMDAFMLLRGIKTLSVRMERQQKTALAVASFLDRLGFRVHYPGLPSNPGYAIHARQARGPGAVLSFETGNSDMSQRVVSAARLFGVTVSFGCVNSLISMPCQMSHASIDARTRAERGLPENLIRLCIGIEDPADVLADIRQALLAAGAVQEVDGELQRVPVEDEMEVLRAQLREKAGAECATAAGATEASAPESLVVSAPGKVILFGEHAVVHGVTAIAAATALRCYARVSPAEGRVSISMRDIDLAQSWDLEELPWHLVEGRTEAPATLDTGLVEALSAIVSRTESPGRRHAACLSFLYLYMSIGGPRAQDFEVRSALPISAGLGSSAAVMTCIASLVLYTHGRIALPHESITREQTSVINGWAFLAEKIMHGEPSGVDNTVAVLGGALAFTRAVEGANSLKENRLVPLRGFGALRLLITDTRVERDTKALVASVSEQKQREPERVGAAFEAIQMVADDAQTLLAEPPARDEFVARLGKLMVLNHLQLVQLGVGHTALEQVRSTCAAQPYGLSTKLTGGGGGGCAITLIRDGITEDATAALRTQLSDGGFVTYETSIGGGGVGVRKDDAPLPDSTDTLGAWADQGTWVYA